MTDTAPITGVAPTTETAGAEEACSCCDSTDPTTDASATTDGSHTEAVSGDIVATYTVSGMTCGHCVNAVSTEIAKLPGVTGVGVDLASGAVMVSAMSGLARAEVAAAVEEAGFELVGAENDAGPGR